MVICDFRFVSNKCTHNIWQCKVHKTVKSPAIEKEKEKENERERKKIERKYEKLDDMIF